MSKPKIVRGWCRFREDRAETGLMYQSDGQVLDHAAATWRRRDGRVFWTACVSNEVPGEISEIDQGTCDTLAQAQAAAEAALLAAGYEFA